MCRIFNYSTIEDKKMGRTRIKVDKIRTFYLPFNNFRSLNAVEIPMDKISTNLKVHKCFVKMKKHKNKKKIKLTPLHCV